MPYYMSGRRLMGTPENPSWLARVIRWIKARFRK